ncbi:MAG: carbohydrate ABC transporter permease [Anaerolineae bacterium]|nr:carbohydrate ABC transporter permease [Anaerolineae bacterium]
MTALAARRSNGLVPYLTLFGLIVLLLIMLSPFAIVVVNAFKAPQEYAANGPISLPSGIYTQGLADFWNRVDFTTKLVNSTVISLSVAVLGVCLSLLNAFALGIGRVRGRVWFLVFFMIANTLPHESLAYPLYYFAKFFKIYDTQFAVILIFTVIQSAFGTYLLSSVFSTFPREMVEAATVDGCNKLQLLFRVVAPISLPSLSVLFVFFFIWTWNEFFLPLIMLISNGKQTVPLAIATLQGQHNMDATTTSASALLGILPCIIFFFLFQRTLTRGITAGSIK